MSVYKRLKQSGVLGSLVQAAKASPEFLKEAKTPQVVAERLGFATLPAGGSYIGYRKLTNPKSGADGAQAPMPNPLLKLPS